MAHNLPELSKHLEAAGPYNHALWDLEALMHEQNKTVTTDHLEVAWKVVLGWGLSDCHNYLTINVTYITTFSKYPQQSLAMFLRKLKFFYLNGLYWALVEYITKKLAFLHLNPCSINKQNPNILLHQFLPN